MAPLERSDAELIAATESMYRIRAVESPPDAKGQRTVWHRAPKHAELVTWVDGEGRAERQELQLFDDVLIWQRVGGFQTGTMSGSDRGYKPSDTMALDPSVNTVRLGRFTRGISSYKGSDKYINHVLQVLATHAAQSFEDQITQPSNERSRKVETGRVTAPRLAPVDAPSRPSRVPLILAAVIGLFVVLALLALLSMFVLV